MHSPRILPSPGSSRSSLSPSSSPSSASASSSHSSSPRFPRKISEDGTHWAFSRLLYSLYDFLFSTLLLVGAAASCTTSRIIVSLRLQSSCSCTDCLGSRSASSLSSEQYLNRFHPENSINGRDGQLDPSCSSSQQQEKGLADSRLDPEQPNHLYASARFPSEEKSKPLLPVNANGDNFESEYQQQQHHHHYPPHHHPFSPSPSDLDDGNDDRNSYVVCRICYKQFLEASYQQSLSGRRSNMMTHGDVQEAIVSEEEKKLRRKKEKKGRTVVFRDSLDSSISQQDIPQAAFMARSMERKKNLCHRKVDHEEEDALDLGKVDVFDSNMSPQHLFMVGSIEEGKNPPHQEDRKERALNARKRDMPNSNTSGQEVPQQGVALARSVEEGKKKLRLIEVHEERPLFDLRNLRKMEMPHTSTSRKEVPRQLFVEEEKKLCQREDREERALNLGNLRKRDMPSSSASLQEVVLQQSFIARSTEEGKKLRLEEKEEEEEEVEESTLDVKNFRKRDMPMSNTSRQEVQQQIFIAESMEEENNFNQEDDDEEEETTSEVRKLGKRDMPKSKASQQEVPQQSFMVGSMEILKKLRQEDKEERKMDMPKANMSKRESPQQIFMVGYMEEEKKLSQEEVDEEEEERASDLRKPGKRDMLKSDTSQQEVPQRSFMFGSMEKVKDLHRKEDEEERTSDLESLGNLAKSDSSMTQLEVPPQTFMVGCIEVVTSVSEFPKEEEPLDVFEAPVNPSWHVSNHSVFVAHANKPNPSSKSAGKNLSTGNTQYKKSLSDTADFIKEQERVPVMVNQITQTEELYFEFFRWKESQSYQKLSATFESGSKTWNEESTSYNNVQEGGAPTGTVPVPSFAEATREITLGKMQSSAGNTVLSEILPEATLINISAREIMTQDSARDTVSSQKLSEAIPIKISAGEIMTQNSAGDTVSSQKLSEAIPITISAREIMTQNSAGDTVASQKLSEAIQIKISAREIMTQNSAGDTVSSQKLSEAIPINISAKEIMTQNSAEGIFSSQKLLEASPIKISTREIVTQNSAGGTFSSQKLLETTPIKISEREIMTQNTAGGTVSSLKLPNVTPIKISTREIKIQNSVGETASSQKLPEATQWKKSSREINSFSSANTGFRIPSHIQDNPQGFRSNVILPLRASRSSGCLEEEAIKAGAKQTFTGFSGKPLWKGKNNNNFKSILSEMSQEPKQIFHAGAQNYGGSPKIQPHVQFIREQEEIIDGDQEGSSNGYLRGISNEFQRSVEGLAELQEDARAREEELAATRELLARSYAKFPGKLPENLGRMVKVRSLPVIHENMLLLEEDEDEKEENDEYEDEDEDEQDKDNVHSVELKVATATATANIEDEHHVNDVEEKMEVVNLREALKEEKMAKSELYAELEKERQAAAISVQETMAMITRLQEEKSAMQLEVEQFRRRVEDKAMYDQQAMDILKEILLKREKEKHALEKEVELYRERLLKSKAEEMKRSQLGNRSALPVKGSDASLEGHVSGNFDSEDNDVDDDDNGDNGYSWQRSGRASINENDNNTGSIGNITPRKREGQNVRSSAVVVGRTALKENKHMVEPPDNSSFNTGQDETWLILERLVSLEAELRQFKEKTPTPTPTNSNPNPNPPRCSRMQVEGRAALQRNSRSFTDRVSESDSDPDLSATSDFHPSHPQANKLKGNGTRSPHRNGIRGGSICEALRHSRRFFPEWDENESLDERGSQAGDVDILSQESSSGGRRPGKDWHSPQENNTHFREEDWHDFPYPDLRTKSMKMRDHKRMIREEEVQQLTGRLQALEADRENLKQALDSVKDQTMGLNLLEKITHQLHEMQMQGRDPNSQENAPEKNLGSIFNNLVQSHGLMPKKSQDVNDREQ